MDNNLAPNSSDVPLRPRPVVLLLLDGWGVAPISEANAITSAKINNFKKIIGEYPATTITTGEKKLNARYLSLGSGQDLSHEEALPLETLSSAIAKANLRQVKITETERLAALTHFFNGHQENKALNEEWIIVSSEAGDHTVKPLLALKRMVKSLIDKINADEIDFIATVWPTLSLMAQSGDFAAVAKAVQTIDKNLQKIISLILEKKGVLIISSTCGNVERMRNLSTELVDTDMTANPVPLIIVGEDFRSKNIGWVDPVDNDLSSLEPIGKLSDLAPTILSILDLPIPHSFTGRSLIDKKQ